MSKTVMLYAVRERRTAGPIPNACNVMFIYTMIASNYFIANVFSQRVLKKKKLEKVEIKAVDGSRKPSNRNKQLKRK